MPANITSELLVYRPLAQFFASAVIPAIDAKIADNKLALADLPIEIQKLQITWLPEGGVTTCWLTMKFGSN